MNGLELELELDMELERLLGHRSPLLAGHDHSNVRRHVQFLRVLA